jgi:hypothetical protein
MRDHVLPWKPYVPARSRSSSTSAAGGSDQVSIILSARCTMAAGNSTWSPTAW